MLDRKQAALIVEVLAAVPEPRRTGLLTALCAGDPALEAEVRAALSPDALAEMELRVRDQAHPLPPPPTPDTADIPPTDSNTDAAPRAIGPYRLLERLGEGGFGVVFAADQTHPIRRRVALKIIKEGMDTRQVVARFEAERQALALMDHPNIARVLDAGTTREGNAGRPYFVMELVRGVPITAYCEENRLSPRQRIELMVPVCHAIQHAHQKGIIHRDIKPSNVLVTILDGKPVPKVIDFGVAKAVAGAQTLTDKTVYTAFRQFIGTPAYMSPEQLLQSGIDVDTRSDVYALGVLIYELLSGTLPFDTESLLKLGLERMQQEVREKDPPKPSTRVLTMNVGQRTTIATARRLQADKLGHALRGEVDWMVMKAVEKDRNRRYQSPTELAEDLQRYLTGQAVHASPPSGWYQLKKFTRRNRVAVALAGVAIAGLLATTLATGIGLKREAAARAVAVASEKSAVASEKSAKEAQTRAEANARVSKAALEFFPVIFNGGDPSAEGGRRDVTVGEMTDRAAALLEQGADTNGRPMEPEVELQTRYTIAQLYYAIGRFGRGIELLNAALPIARRVSGPVSEDELQILMSIHWGHFNGAGTRDDFLDVSRRIEEMAAAIPNRQSPFIGAALGTKSLTLHGQTRNAEALAVDRQRIAFWEKLQPEHRFNLAVSCIDAALNAAAIGRVKDALQFSEQGLKLHASTKQEIMIARPLTIRAMALAMAERFDEAEESARKSVEICDRLLGPDHPGRLFEHGILSAILIQRGKLDEGAKLYAAIMAVKQKNNVPPRLGDVFPPITLNRMRGNTADALRAVLQLKAIADALPPDSPDKLPLGHPANADAYTGFCGILTDNARPAEGIAALGPVYDAFIKNLGEDPDNYFARKMAAEFIRAAEASGTPEHLELAKTMRAKYPGVQPAKGYGPLAK